MTTKKKTATRPVAVPPPAPDSFAARRDADTRARIAMFDGLADQVRAVAQGLADRRSDSTPMLHPESHSALCLTCGASFDIASGFCVEERPDHTEIPFETTWELQAVATDADLSLDETAARLISVGLYVLGRGAWRERDDLFDLWAALHPQPKATAAATA